MTRPEMRDRFSVRFRAECSVIARAPGRVNLIGEHTDYNDGLVLPIASEQDTWVAVGPRGDGVARAFSTELRDEQRWPVEDWRPDDNPHWTSYVAGVASLLRRRGVRLSGFDLLISSDVPVGGGLSSSAALEVATALALTRMSGQPLEATDVIDLCRQAEHDFAGVPCGLMDQSVSLLAEPGRAFLLDCRSRDYRQVPCVLDRHVLVVVDSGVRHNLAAGEYAQRQQECRQAVQYFQRIDPRVTALRDVSPEMVRDHGARMDATIAARARHVTSENARTLAAAEALRAGDLAELGRLMSESHSSLRDDYEVSCRELDQLVERLCSVNGVLGARMTGGGFGGCVVGLALESSMEAIEAEVSAARDAGCAASTGVLRTRPGRGASVESG